MIVSVNALSAPNFTPHISDQVFFDHVFRITPYLQLLTHYFDVIAEYVLTLRGYALC